MGFQSFGRTSRGGMTGNGTARQRGGGPAVSGSVGYRGSGSANRHLRAFPAAPSPNTGLYQRRTNASTSHLIRGFAARPPTSSACARSLKYRGATSTVRGTAALRISLGRAVASGGKDQPSGVPYVCARLRGFRWCCPRPLRQARDSLVQFRFEHHYPGLDRAMVGLFRFELGSYFL